jgi:hypothetical protein
MGSTPRSQTELWQKRTSPRQKFANQRRRKFLPPSVTAETKKFVEGVGRALRRAAKVARKVAKEHGTPIYVWENGKVVAKKP